MTEQEAINSLLDFLARCAVADVLAEQLEPFDAADESKAAARSEAQ